MKVDEKQVVVTQTEFKEVQANIKVAVHTFEQMKGMKVEKAFVIAAQWIKEEDANIPLKFLLKHFPSLKEDRELLELAKLYKRKECTALLTPKEGCPMAPLLLESLAFKILAKL